MRPRRDPDPVERLRALSGDVATDAERLLAVDGGKAALERALARTTPVLAVPAMDLDSAARDLWLMLAQPEIADVFWPQWELARGSRGPAPRYAETKALMTVSAGLGNSPHILQSHRMLGNDPGLQAVFQWLELQSPSRRGMTATFALRDYKTALKHIPGLGASCWPLALETNVALLQGLRQLMPDAGIGERLLIDGTDVAAWAPQKSSRGEVELEKAFRARTPYAGFRMYGYSGNGKQTLSSDEKVRPGTSKVWRGYHLVVLVDQATGRPIVWTLQDAAHDEAAALKELLYMLYRLWPDCPAELIAGDAAWDEHWACEWCEVRYGLHPIFRRHPSYREREHVLTADDSTTLAGFTGEGRALCRRHGLPLQYASSQFAGRRDLQPGEMSDARAFRVRFRCDHGGPGGDSCGKPGLPMSRNWSGLTFYPHHPFGRPDLHAMRVALLGRRNSCESLFSSLKLGHKLGLRGPDRTRLTSFDSVLGLISLAFLLKTAFVVADQRIRRGLFQHEAPVAA